MYCEDVFEYDEEDPEVWLLQQVCASICIYSDDICIFIVIMFLNLTSRILIFRCFARCVSLPLSLPLSLSLFFCLCSVFVKFE